jgi:glyoxylase-like metal-dependent hydrolase (beta-lactamase superfamily II)
MGAAGPALPFLDAMKTVGRYTAPSIAVQCHLHSHRAEIMRLSPAESWYEVKELEHGIARIDEVQLHEFARSNIWLVSGSEQVLLVDTGTGLGPLREVVESVTDRPVIAFATTGYYDHAGGLHQFDSRLIHRLAADQVQHPSPRRVVSDKYLTTTAFKALPEVGFDPAGYRMVPTTPTRLVEDGDVIDLGDRKIEGHSPPGHHARYLRAARAGIWKPPHGGGAVL